MNQHVNEDVMWERLKDIVTEGQNRKLSRASGRSVLGRLWRSAGQLVSEATRAAGLAPRWWAEPSGPQDDETPAASDAA